MVQGSQAQCARRGRLGSPRMTVTPGHVRPSVAGGLQPGAGAGQSSGLGGGGAADPSPRNPAGLLWTWAAHCGPTGPLLP